MIISIIVAVSKNNVIGYKGRLPWRIPGERKRFRDLTLGKTVIMGRRSYEEIGRPLPERKNIIISREGRYIAENCITVKTLQEALEFAKNEDEVFIAGGGELFKDVLPYTDRIYLTVIDKEFEGDVFFPPIDENEFRKTYEKRIEGEIPYTYYTFERKRQRVEISRICL
jgi:dihydrofolate reductase